MRLLKEECIIESILFVAGEPVSVAAIAGALGYDIKTAKKLVEGLKCKYDAEKRGINLIEVDGAYQMCTDPSNYEYVKRIYQSAEEKPLSQTLLETLSIVAYTQPVTKARIEQIRGVNADHAVNKLMEYGLVCERGRLDAPGRPILFGTTDDFLKHFGMTSIKQLPELNSGDELV